MKTVLMMKDGEGEVLTAHDVCLMTMLTADRVFEE